MEDSTIKDPTGQVLGVQRTDTNAKDLVKPHNTLTLVTDPDNCPASSFEPEWTARMTNALSTMALDLIPNPDESTNGQRHDSSDEPVPVPASPLDAWRAGRLRKLIARIDEIKRRYTGGDYVIQTAALHDSTLLKLT